MQEEGSDSEEDPDDDGWTQVDTTAKKVFFDRENRARKAAGREELRNEDGLAEDWQRRAGDGDDDAMQCDEEEDDDIEALIRKMGFSFVVQKTVPVSMSHDLVPLPMGKGTVAVLIPKAPEMYTAPEGERCIGETLVYFSAVEGQTVLLSCWNMARDFSSVDHGVKVHWGADSIADPVHPEACKRAPPRERTLLTMEGVFHGLNNRLLCTTGAYDDPQQA